MHERRKMFYRFGLCIVEMISYFEPTLKIHPLRSKKLVDTVAVHTFL